jgi:hypothetical protein
MDALRVRLGSVVEWAVAAAFLAATVAVASLIIAAIAAPRLAAPSVAVAVARPVAGTQPSGVPAGAVSVPVLPFRDGTEIRVGDTAVAVAARLGRAAEVGRQEVDRAPLGERLTRFYDHAGFRFIVVYEPFERGGEQRVAAIYLP